MTIQHAFAVPSKQETGLLSRGTIAAARGIGIVLVVLGHINPLGVPGISVYGFHMPLFFFLSGMTLRREPPLTGLVLRDARSLLLYAMLHFGLIALITIAAFQSAGMSIQASSPLDWRTYALWPFTRNSEHVHLFLIAWFLLALFFVRLASVLFLKAIWRLPKALAIALTLGIALITARSAIHGFAAAYDDTKFWLWNICAQVMLGTAFCLAGYVAQNHAPSPFRRALDNRGHPAITAMAIYALLVLLQLPPFIMSSSQYPGGTIQTFLNAGLGIGMIVFLAQASRDQKALLDLGRRSKTIMTWHLTAMAALNLLFVAVGLLEAGSVGPFTTLEMGRFWPLYLAVGILIPVFSSRAPTVWRRYRTRPTRLSHVAN